MNPCPQCSSAREHLEAPCKECGWSPQEQRAPGQASVSAASPKPTKASRRSTLWWAFAVSPLIAPTTFAVCFFVFGLIALAINPDHSGTPIGVILVPAIALTLGVVACYLITCIFAMPVIFYLDKIQKLNALTIITTALSCLASCIAVGCVFGLLNRGDGSAVHVVTTSAGLFLLLSPFVLASAIAFWWIQRQGLHGMSFRSMILGVTLLAAVLALAAPILRRLFS